jgi:hypothetical protein
VTLDVHALHKYTHEPRPTARTLREDLHNGFQKKNGRHNMDEDWKDKDKDDFNRNKGVKL